MQVQGDPRRRVESATAHAWRLALLEQHGPCEHAIPNAHTDTHTDKCACSWAAQSNVYADGVKYAHVISLPNAHTDTHTDKCACSNVYADGVKYAHVISLGATNVPAYGLADGANGGSGR